MIMRTPANCTIAYKKMTVLDIPTRSYQMEDISSRGLNLKFEWSTKSEAEGFFKAPTSFDSSIADRTFFCWYGAAMFL